jgi:hypothetical protein
VVDPSEEDERTPEFTACARRIGILGSRSLALQDSMDQGQATRTLRLHYERVAVTQKPEAIW